MRCVEHGAIQGTTPLDANGMGTFDPEGKVTVGQFLAVITRLVCPDEIRPAEGKHWATGNYIAAVNSRIILSDDFDASNQGLDSRLTRQEMAYILVRAALVNGEELEEKEGVQALIHDFDNINPSKRHYVLRAYSNGLLLGDNHGLFNPKGETTRAQMAAVVCRLMQYEPRPAVNVEERLTQGIYAISENEYIIVEGSNAGKLKAAYTDQIAKEFYSSARFYTDANGKLAFSVTLPEVHELARQFNTKYDIGMMVYDKQDNYIANFSFSDWQEGVNMNPGAVIDQTLIEWSQWEEERQPVTVSEIGYISLHVFIYTDAGSLRSYDSSSNWGTAILGKVTGRMDSYVIDCNTVPVYEGVGLYPLPE